MQVVARGDYSGQYTIDSNDFWSVYGWMIESGSDALLQLPKSKEVYTKDWKGQNGKQYDLTKRFFDDKTVTLSGHLIADDEGDFWAKYLALWELIKSPGTRTIYSFELKQTFAAFYLESPNTKRFTRLQDHPGKIAMKLDVQFQVMFMEFDPPTNVPRPPIVNAGGNRIITLPTNQLTINGASAVPRGTATIVTLQWEFVSGVSGITPGITGGGILAPTFTGLTASGIYNFRLRATDSNGLTATNTMSVTVNPAPSIPGPIAYAGPDLFGTTSDNVINITQATATPGAPGVTIDTINWAYEYSNPEAMSLIVNVPPFEKLKPQLFKPGMVNFTPGQYVVSLTVVDSNGKQHTDEMTLTITEPASGGFPYTFPYNLS